MLSGKIQSAFEAIGDYHNHAKFMPNSGNSLRVYSTQSSRGVWSYALWKNFESQSPSETTITTQNLWQTQAIHCVYIAHSLLVGVGVMLSGKMLKVRVLLRPLENTVTTRSLWQTWSIHCMVISRRPFPLQSAFVFEALPQNCLLGAADLSRLWGFTGHEQ